METDETMVHGPGEKDKNKKCTYKDFKTTYPPVFNGELDQQKAYTWIREIEKVFEITNCLEEQKVKFATYSLRDEALFWWDVVEKTTDDKVSKLEDFKKLFREKYIPRNIENEMELKFLNLKQGNMSVAKYLSKFLKLSRYATYQVNTEARKCLRFENVLRPVLKDKVSILEIENFDVLVAKSNIAEKNEEERKKYLNTKKI